MAIFFASADSNSDHDLENFFAYLVGSEFLLKENNTSVSHGISGGTDATGDASIYAHERELWNFEPARWFGQQFP